LTPRTGNKPPWTLPAKAAYSGYDSARAKQYFGAKDVKTPEFFPILSLLPQRALCFIKDQHPDRFVSTFLDIFEAMWKNGKDVSKPDTLAETLQSIFSPEEVKAVLSSANSAMFKQRLNDNTKEALDRGAFGAPWFWVRNAKGAEEPFFGSDRYATVLSRSLFIAGRFVSGKVSAPTDGERVRNPANSVCMAAVKRRSDY
jgi:glutathione S-transferase kappa 1